MALFSTLTQKGGKVKLDLKEKQETMDMYNDKLLHDYKVILLSFQNFIFRRMDGALHCKLLLHFGFIKKSLNLLIRDQFSAFWKGSTDG